MVNFSQAVYSPSKYVHRLLKFMSPKLLCYVFFSYPEFLPESFSREALLWRELYLIKIQCVMYSGSYISRRKRCCCILVTLHPKIATEEVDTKD